MFEPFGPGESSSERFRIDYRNVTSANFHIFLDPNAIVDMLPKRGPSIVGRRAFRVSLSHHGHVVRKPRPLFLVHTLFDLPYSSLTLQTAQTIMRPRCDRFLIDGGRRDIRQCISERFQSSNKLFRGSSTRLGGLFCACFLDLRSEYRGLDCTLVSFGDGERTCRSGGRVGTRASDARSEAVSLGFGYCWSLCTCQ